MSENKESVDARRIKDPTSARAEGKETSPGDFAWEFDFTHFDHGAKPEDTELTVYIHLPGESHWTPIHVQRGAQGGPHVWGWNGDFDRPTFTPSIWNKGVWHGHMTGGRLISCP